MRLPEIEPGPLTWQAIDTKVPFAVDFLAFYL